MQLVCIPYCCVLDSVVLEVNSNSYAGAEYENLHNSENSLTYYILSILCIRYSEKI